MAGEMIQYLPTTEKQQCRRLWGEAFPEDSKEFRDYYFEEKLKDNRILAWMEEEVLEIQEATEENRVQRQIDAMIHQNPYLLMVKGQQWRIDYLVGVATRKEKRHQGYMRRLLMKAMAEMNKEEMAFCFLMPADEAIYRPFGFTFIFRQPWFVWGDQKNLEKRRLFPRNSFTENTGELKEAAMWMNDWLKRHYQVYSVRDEAYLQNLEKELSSENGFLDVFYHQGEIVAMESWWGLKDPERRLLYGESPYIKDTGEAGKPAIMARIISLKRFVRVIRLREAATMYPQKRRREREESLDPDIRTEGEAVVCLRVLDPLIKENDGLWLWHLNRETSWLERNVQEEEADLTLKIEELTAWLFGYQVPEKAREFASQIETLQGVFLDEIV